MYREFAQPQSIDPPGRELDRHRKTIQLAADVGDDRGVLIAELEPAQDRRCPLDEQLYRREAQRLRGREPR